MTFDLSFSFGYCVSMNRVYLSGRLTIEPKIKGGKMSFCTVVLACKRERKSRNGEYIVDFVPITTINEVATNFCLYCHKGDLIECEGTIVSTNSSHYVKVTNFNILYRSGTQLGELDTPDSISDNDSEDELN